MWRRPIWGLVAILLISAIVRWVAYTDNTPHWDAASYVLMGKYMFSSGEVGLWEDMRPLVWPAILGATWRVGIDALAAGQVWQVLFGLLMIAATYGVGRRIDQASTGLVAALLLAASPITFNWGNHLYTGIPATGLAMLGTFLACRARWFAAGLVLGLAAMTRFPVGLTAVPLLALVWGRATWRRDLAAGAAGVIVVVAPYLIFNAIQYGHPLHPFRQASLTFGAYTHIWNVSPAFYLNFLWRDENPLLALAPAALWLYRGRRAQGVLWVGWLFVLVLSMGNIHLARYIVPALPTLYLAAAMVLVRLIRGRPRRYQWGLVLLAAAITVVPWKRNLREFQFEPRATDVFQEAVAQYAELGGEEVWISSPPMLVLSDLRATELMYYPVFDAARAQTLLEKLSDAPLVMMSRYDLPCTPEDDPDCLAGRDELFGRLRTERRVLWESTDAAGRVEAGIYLPVASGGGEP